MEKFHKYCLSVLLVIICSNISAQISNGTVESEDCKQLYELYNQILNHDCDGLKGFCTNKENSKQNFAIHQKLNAIDLIGKIFSGNQYDHSFHNKTGADFSDEYHHQLLKNFEKSGRENLFTFILYFKSKVSKVRNKDYLESVI